MATEAATVAATAAETTATPVQTPEERSEALIQRHARAAAVDAAAEPEGAAEGGSTGERPRGPDGKFLPEKKAKAKGKDDASGKKEDKAASEAVPKPAAHSGGGAGEGSADSAEDPTPAPEPLTGGLGKARRLAQEGKLGEALKMIGVDAEKLTSGQWGAWRKENARREREIVAAHQEVERQRESVKAEARQLVAELRPYAEAAEALKSGDEDRVFEIIFGKSVDEWQRERLGRMHRGDLRKDPVVTELKKLFEAEKTERQKLEQRLLEREEAEKLERAKAEQQRAQETYRADLAARLADSGDPRLERAASLPWFVQKVHQLRLDSYRIDPMTGREDCLSEEEAIEAAYDEDKLTVAQWKQLTGSLPAAANRGPDTQNQVATDRRGTDVRRAAKAPTTLSRSEAADAVTHEKPPPGSKELVEYHARLAQRAANS